MATIKISSKVEEAVWRDLQAFAGETHQSISGMLTEAIADYLRRRRMRPEVLAKLEDAIATNTELGRQLVD